MHRLQQGIGTKWILFEVLWAHSTHIGTCMGLVHIIFYDDDT